LTATQLEAVEATPLHQRDDGTVVAEGTSLFHDDYRFIASVPLKRLTGLKLEILTDAKHTDGKYSTGVNGEFILTDVKLQIRKQGSSQLTDIELGSAVASVEKKVKGRNYGLVKDTLDDDPRNGWTTEGVDEIETRTAVFALEQPLELIESISSESRTRLLNQFLVDHVHYQEIKAALDRAQRQLSSLQKLTKNIRVQVLKRKAEPRTTHVLVRGVWDKKGELVSPGVPAAILDAPNETEPSRIDLANWLISTDNPLTARVIVNQLWQLCFGTGLVRTPGDFGLQGEQPTHPDLLDWLAVEFIESGWDVKHIMKLIVTSRTYQQSSELSPELLLRDPENRLLARGARYRLASWMIRDAWLKSSGLLNPALGGPPVYPYQPQGVWAEMFMGRFNYEPSQGQTQYRRTIYAFWRRSAAPTFLFDSAQRRVCEVRPRRTNTPLHALTLLNDRTSLEASEVLANAVDLQEKSIEIGISFLTKRILSRDPLPEEQIVIEREFTSTLNYYRQHPQQAFELVNIKQLPRQPTDQDAELAAWMVTASMIYNLDEAITHE